MTKKQMLEKIKDLIDIFGNGSSDSEFNIGIRTGLNIALTELFPKEEPIID